MIKQLIDQTAQLANRFQLQNYKSLSQVIQHETQFTQTEEYNSLQSLLKNNTLDKSVFNIGKDTEQTIFRPDIITYALVSECPKQMYSIGIFFIPQNFVMPLHDHPGMHVLQKVLYGKAIKSSITLNSKENIAKQFTFPMRLTKSDQLLNCKIQEDLVKENDFKFILPTQDNIHSYKAVENFAFLDILVPHYDFKQRFCNFYDILEINKDVCQLRIKPMSNDYETKRIFLDINEQEQNPFQQQQERQQFSQ